MPTYDAGKTIAIYYLSADAALKTQRELIEGYKALMKDAQVKPPKPKGKGR